MTLESLQEECADSMRYRGHDPVCVQVTEDMALYVCMNCGMEAQVLSWPMPNQIDIGGEAVALNC
jgi:hypothetical protein